MITAQFKDTKVIKITMVDGDNNPLNLSTTTLKQVHFMRPDGTTLIKTASFFTDGTDGIIMVTLDAGDLNLSGSWYLQGYIEEGTLKWHGEKLAFVVRENLIIT